MAPPFTSTHSPAPSPMQDHEEQQQLQHKDVSKQSEETQEQQQPHLPSVQEENEYNDALAAVEPTNVTIKTDIDPHHETTTTTTIVHLPFQLARQCPPPKVISWMKSNKVMRSKSTAQPKHRHHPHQRRSQSSPALLQHVLPFLFKRKGTVDTTKKGDRAVTVFSIQVTVLGRVLVPPTTPTPEQEEIADSNNDSTTATNNKALELELAPTKTIPAQLNRSETTSYVIHRTFDDFERLSEMVLRLEHSLHGHGHHEAEHGSGEHETTLSSSEAPALTALRVHHPYPGLYQALLKQFSNVKANQRAFDASSTTHGFNEEGAFERVLELNQYLENVWYWLLPENTPSQLDLSTEQQEIMHWFKPLEAHADGRQMRDRQEQDQKESRHQSQFLQQYGSMSSLRKSQEPASKASTLEARATTASAGAGSGETVTAVQAPQVTSGHAGRVKQSSERSISASSLPSLSSASTSTSGSSMSLSSDAGRKNHTSLNENDDDIHGHAVHGSPRTSSTVASSTLQSSTSLNGLAKDDKSLSPDPVEIESSDLTGGELPLFSRTGSVVVQRRGLHERDGSDPLPGAEKVKRRISLSHVLRSLTSPLNNHASQRHSMHEAAHKRSVSASVPSSPTRKGSFTEDIIIWNSVTTKNAPGLAKPTVVSSPTPSSR